MNTNPAVRPQWFNTRTVEQGVSDARVLFSRSFGSDPQGVWSAPGRVNLIGEHVDYAAGICLPFALSQRTYVAAARNGGASYRLVSHFGGEDVRLEIPVAEVGVGNPANWAGYVVGSVWAAREAGVIGGGEDPQTAGIDFAIVSDVPVGAGLSSSAALECSAALAAYDLWAPAETHADDAARRGLMAGAIRAENEVVGASTGGLDQRISLFGQPGHALEIDFLNNTDAQVPFDIAERGLCILIMNTNAPHSLADGQYASRRAVIDGVTEDLDVPSLRVAEDAVARSRNWAVNHVPEGQEEAAWVELVGRRVRHVVSEIERTAEAIALIRGGDVVGFGAAMNASHESLRHDYEVTVPELNTAVEIAREHGALGARMTGGGFGGSVIALLDSEKVEEVAQAVAEGFAARSFNAPEFAVATPGPGARRH